MSSDHQAEREQAAREWLDANDWVFAHDLAIEQDRINVLVALLASTEQRVLEEAVDIVQSEEELLGDMPDEMFQAITGGDRELAEETLRCVVRATKKSIKARLRQQAKERGV